MGNGGFTRGWVSGSDRPDMSSALTCQNHRIGGLEIDGVVLEFKFARRIGGMPIEEWAR